MRVLVAALTIPPLLRLASLDRVAGRLGRPARVKQPGADQQLAIARAVDHLLERLPAPWRKTCLTRSVVLFHLLRRSGIPVHLCLGVRRDQNVFAAHAWLIRDREPYLEPSLPSFEVIATFPPGSAPGETPRATSPG